MTDTQAGLLGVPYQLLVDALLPLLELSDLLTLRAVAPGLRAAIDDDVVWRRRIVRDFRFPLSSSARSTGWKTLYRGLSDAELFTWGDYSCDRLGVRFRALRNETTADSIARVGAHLWLLISRVHCVPLPIRVAWRDADWYDGSAHVIDGRQARHETPAPWGGVVVPYAQRQILPNGRRDIERKSEVGVPVQLHAGGWSFFALTHLGQVMAFGKSAGMGMTVETEPAFVTPTLLDLGGRSAKQLCVGRAHVVALMDDGVLLEWSQRWDRPAMHLAASLADEAGFDGRPTHVRQVEAGWDFTAILVDDASGPQADGDDDDALATSSVRNEVLIWKTEWTYGELRKQWYETSQSETDPQVEIDAEWPISMATVKLPTLSERIKRIAAGDRFVIALTENGVLYYLGLPEVQVLESHGTARQQAEGVRQSLIRNFVQWKRMTLFCDTPYDAGWNTDHSENVWNKEGLEHLLAQSSTKITHVSAQFQSFAVYAPEAGKTAQNRDGGQGSGIVILGTKDKLDAPVVIPELQGIGVVKVVHGDWHMGALTQDGRVLTWGSQSNGALGTWDAIDTPENAESLLSSHDAQIPVPNAGLGRTATGVFRRIMRLRQLEGTEDEAQEEQRSDEAPRDTVRSTSIAGAASKDDMVHVERRRYRYRRLPDKVVSPQQVRFGFPMLGERRGGRAVQMDDEQETKFVFDVAFAGWHSGALAVDRRLLSDDG